jgi:sugar-specific transcriptional regulator TrmB
MESLNQKETNMYDEFSQKIKEYEEQYNEKLEELKKRERDAVLTDYARVKQIEKMINDYYTTVPWYHNEMWQYKSKIEEVIREFKNL